MRPGRLAHRRTARTARGGPLPRRVPEVGRRPRRPADIIAAMAAVDLAASTSEDEAVGPGGARRRRRHTTVAVCLFFLALVLAMFWPSLVGGKVLSAGDRTWFQSPFISQKPSSLVRPSNKDLADPVEVFHPDTWRARQALADGSAALWNPNVGAGRPLLASQQFSPLFPTQWPAFVLPFKDAWGWIAALKLLVAAFGQYLFCRPSGCAPGRRRSGASRSASRSTW